jgi:hypothetical protein
MKKPKRRKSGLVFLNSNEKNKKEEGPGLSLWILESDWWVY